MCRAVFLNWWHLTDYQLGRWDRALLRRFNQFSYSAAKI